MHLRRPISPIGVWKAAALAVALASVLVAGAACSRQEEVPPLERRAQQLNKAIMCPVCPGESIDQSQHRLAVQMRAIVDEKMREGWSEGQIKEFFVERYGPSVLLAPPRRGFSLLVWVLPPFAVLLVVLALYVSLRLMVRRSPAGQPLEVLDSVQLSEDERAEYFRRIAAIGYDGGPAPATADEAGGPEAMGRADD